MKIITKYNQNDKVYSNDGLSGTVCKIIIYCQEQLDILYTIKPDQDQNFIHQFQYTYNEKDLQLTPFDKKLVSKLQNKNEIEYIKRVIYEDIMPVLDPADKPTYQDIKELLLLSNCFSKKNINHVVRWMINQQKKQQRIK